MGKKREKVLASHQDMENKLLEQAMMLAIDKAFEEIQQRETLNKGLNEIYLEVNNEKKLIKDVECNLLSIRLHDQKAVRQTPQQQS